MFSGLVACDRAPLQEREVAVAAYEKARRSEARSLAGEPFLRAETALQQGDIELDFQAKRFSLWRRYRRAREFYTQAAQSARQSEQLAGAARARLAAQAEQGRESVRGDLAALEQALATAPATTRESLRRRLVWLQEEMDRAAQAQSAGDINGARAIQERIHQQQASLRRDLNLKHR